MASEVTEVIVESVHVHAESSQHVVLLRERRGERYLPIWIGPWEASAIATRLQGMLPDRPLTHDLYTRTLLELGVRVERVVVSDLSEDTYRARIVLEQGELDVEVDARPSDAIAIALRADAPMFVANSVLDRAGVLPGAEQDRRLSMFREFVNSLEFDLGGGAGTPEREGPGS
ncbi:MAG: bifunctional nuclease family protein [Chloroflexi bacterium]|nr:bifunctional nuclease family protein [Chloroflexota bacterium]